MEYYKAYDERYKIYHSNKGQSWAGEQPSVELADILKKYKATKESQILEVGCGEGQNARFLLKQGFNLRASDVSNEAISWCKQNIEKNVRNNFFVLDILNNNFTERFDFIISISTLHMLVLNKDRKKFFDFLYSHLQDDGIAIITSMGDGDYQQNKSDITKAFELVERDNGSGKMLLPQTSCRIVDWKQLTHEIESANLKIIDKYISTTISGFNSSMVAIIKKK